MLSVLKKAMRKQTNKKNHKGTKETVRSVDMPIILIVVMVLQVLTCVQTHQTAHTTCEQFFIYRLFLNKAVLKKQTYPHFSHFLVLSNNKFAEQESIMCCNQHKSWSQTIKRVLSLAYRMWMVWDNIGIEIKSLGLGVDSISAPFKILGTVDLKQL